MIQKADAPSARILVVDDEAPAQRLLVRILEKKGHFAQAVSDISTAAALLEQEHFDLVMTDLDMPGGSGLELIDVLGPRSPDVATILVTGAGSTQIASRALMSGAYGYLNKPFLADEVDVTVFNALRRRELEIESVRQRESLEAIVRERTIELAGSLAELQSAQYELEEKANQLEELDLMKSQFIQVVSHELRTPLTIIKGAVQTVIRTGESTDPILREQLLRSIQSNAEDLGRMINKILIVATIQRGSIELGHDRFRLDDVAREAATEAAPSSSGRVALRATEARVFGQRDLVKGAVHDLIENALIHTEGRVTVSTWQLGDEGVLSVSDEGPGPPEELLQRLLNEPFVQGDSSTTRSIGGLGLSLYVAKRIVEASSGRFEVKTSEKGSTFSLTLPVAPPEAG